MLALIFSFMPAFFGGGLGAFARGLSLCILCSDQRGKKTPHGATLADRLSTTSGLSAEAVLSARGLCKRKGK